MANKRYADLLDRHNKLRYIVHCAIQHMDEVCEKPCNPTLKLLKQAVGNDEE